MKQKPLIRWTIGPPACRHDCAILKRSIRNFLSLYGDQFDYLLCVNGRSLSEFDSINPKVKLMKQVPVLGCPNPKGCAWKLYPPRIRPESHEIFIDHDLVFVDVIEKVNDFLASKNSFIYAQSEFRNYGRFDGIVSKGFRLNSGIFGIPPGKSLDIASAGDWVEYFDDQGFIASIFCREKNLIRIDLEEIWICDKECMPKFAKGYHFVKDRRDKSWLNFLRSTTI